MISRVLAAAALVAAAAQPPAVTAIDSDGLTRVIRESGASVLVVNMWATWCAPCREEFPDLVKFHKAFEGRGVGVVSVSMDLPSDLESKVIPFLRDQKAGFPSYIKTPGGDEAFINAIDETWSGGLPATFIYDASGRLVKSIHGTTSHDSLAELVRPMLSQD